MARAADDVTFNSGGTQPACEPVVGILARTDHDVVDLEYPRDPIDTDVQPMLIDLFVAHAVDELHLVPLQPAAQNPSRRLTEPFANAGAAALEYVNLLQGRRLGHRKAPPVGYRRIDSPLTVEVIRRLDGRYPGTVRVPAQELCHIVRNAPRSHNRDVIAYTCAPLNHIDIAEHLGMIDTGNRRCARQDACRNDHFIEPFSLQ